MSLFHYQNLVPINPGITWGHITELCWRISLSAYSKILQFAAKELPPFLPLFLKHTPMLQKWQSSDHADRFFIKMFMNFIIWRSRYNLETRSPGFCIFIGAFWDLKTAKLWNPFNKTHVMTFPLSPWLLPSPILHNCYLNWFTGSQRNPTIGIWMQLMQHARGEQHVQPSNTDDKEVYYLLLDVFLKRSELGFVLKRCSKVQRYASTVTTWPQYSTVYCLW